MQKVPETLQEWLMTTSLEAVRGLIEKWVSVGFELSDLESLIPLLEAEALRVGGMRMACEAVLKWDTSKIENISWCDGYGAGMNDAKLLIRNCTPDTAADLAIEKDRLRVRLEEVSNSPHDSDCQIVVTHTTTVCNCWKGERIAELTRQLAELEKRA